MSTISTGNTINTGYVVTGDLTGNLAFSVFDNLPNVSTSGSIIIPIGTAAQRPSSPVNGMIRYNTSVPCLEGYANNTWVGFL